MICAPSRRRLPLRSDLNLAVLFRVRKYREAQSFSGCENFAKAPFSECNFNINGFGLLSRNGASKNSKCSRLYKNWALQILGLNPSFYSAKLILPWQKSVHTIQPMALTFSKTFGVVLDGTQEWFDPCLWLDSPLCVDPFLMLDLEEDDEFKGAHDEIIQFFQRQFNRVASAGTDLHSYEIQKVIRAMLMPEARELFLGYSEGTQGAGSGQGLATLMVRAIMTSIAYGLKDVQHFEEISILGGGIGPDRISDAAIGIPKYLVADIGRYGVYLLVSYDGFRDENVEALKMAARSVSDKGIEIDVMVVDASRYNKPSASKL